MRSINENTKLQITPAVAEALLNEAIMLHQRCDILTRKLEVETEKRLNAENRLFERRAA